MKRILLKISYDGTQYHGWQVQPNAITIQEVLNTSLEKLLGVKTDVVGASRTDAGVHAKEFCCHLDCDNNIPESAFLRGLNSLLPSDIAVNECVLVPNDFHARYDCKGKTYVYNILNSNKKDPFALRYAWQIERKLDEKLMNDFCKEIIGTYDFYAFSSSGRTVEDTVRTVSDCFVKRKGDNIIFSITANGFLYNMVRIAVGTAVDVSLGKIKVEEIKIILNSKDRSRAGVTAPPQGLFLNKVYY